MAEHEYTTVEEHERGSVLRPPKAPYEALADIRQMSRDHIAAARHRIDRSRRRLDRNGHTRATQELSSPVPLPLTAPQATPAPTPTPRSYWCPSCMENTPLPANFCRHCGAPVMSQVTAALIRSRRRIFAAGVVAFTPLLARVGLEVDPFWQEAQAVLSRPALVQHDEAIIRRWYASLGLDYDADFEAVRAHVRATVGAMRSSRSFFNSVGRCSEALTR